MTEPSTLVLVASGETTVDYSPLIPLLILVGIVVFFIYRSKIFKSLQQKEKSQEQIEMERRGREILLERIKSGKIHQEFIAGELPLELRPDEKPLVILPFIALGEPRAVRIGRSTWGGPSFRVTKGLWFRTGSSYSTSESHEELRWVDMGTLALTNERLVFVGKFRTINVKLNKIVGLVVIKMPFACIPKEKKKHGTFSRRSLKHLPLRMGTRPTAYRLMRSC